MPTFYRIVRTDPPTEADFLSYEALGRQLRRETPELRRSWSGVSVYTSERAAREIAARLPRLGAFIAELEVVEDGPVTYEQNGADLEHYDLYGSAEDMLRLVRRVTPV